MPRGNPTEKEIAELHEAMRPAVQVAVKTIANFLDALQAFRNNEIGKYTDDVELVAKRITELFVMADRAGLLE